MTVDRKAFVPLTRVESVLQDHVSQQAGIAVTALCTAGGRTVPVSAPGTKVDCTVTNANSIRYTVTIGDPEGHLTPGSAR